MRGTRGSDEGGWDGFREDRDDWHGASVSKGSRTQGQKPRHFS